MFLSSAIGTHPAVLLALSIVGFLAYGFTKYYLASRRPKGFPFGPDTVPFLGNLHQIPSTKIFMKFHEWRKEHGDIIGLKFGPQNVVVLNNHQHVKELFDKRGAIYSSRPENYIGNQLICPGNAHLLLLPYSAGWRQLRKSVQQLLNVSAVDDKLPIQAAEATQTLHDLLQNPGGYFEHIRRYSTAVTLASVYGQRGARFEDEKIRRLYHAQDQFTAILEPGATPPVDAFPYLQYLPGILAPWKRKARAIQREQRGLYLDLLQETKEALKEGKSEDCFMARLLRDQEKNEMTDQQLLYVGGGLMEAGSDTTSSTLLSFYLAMIAYPAVLKKCQEEVDALCKDRSPSVEDIKSLPYLKACMTETLRWRPVPACGIPHVLTEDNIYNNYMIPKDTMLFANAWAIHHDEKEYYRPSEFIPERFLDNKFGTKEAADGKNDDNRRITYAFGAGRRVCSGQRFAENSLIMNMAKIIWTFNITSSTPVDTSIETGYTGGFLICPLKFPAIFTPRSEEHTRIVEEEFIEAERFLERFS